MSIENKNYNTISPSAAFLIQLKAYTSIPFAKETAAIVDKETPGMAEYIRQAGIAKFFKWILHFENRYHTIEKLAAGLSAKNILEISSGYSFRGLSMCIEKDIHFIDTDLPDMIRTKQNIIANLSASISSNLKGKLELLPLNAVNENEFKNIIDKFSPGPVTILNEGLLMYLGHEEKRMFCRNIYTTLKERGGAWITADTYIRRSKEEDNADILNSSEEAKRFREEHHIEENKFSSFKEAEEFFAGCGLRVTKKLVWCFEELSCLQLLPESKREEIMQQLKNKAHDHETWQLEAI